MAILKIRSIALGILAATSLFMLLSLLQVGSSQVPGLPFTVYGFVFFQGSPQGNVQVEIINNATSESLLTTTSQDGSWIENLGNLKDGYSEGDTLLVIASYDGKMASQEFTISGQSPQKIPDMLLIVNEAIALPILGILLLPTSQILLSKRRSV